MADRQGWWNSGMAGVVGIAVATVLVHLATGWRYGFDRDELMALEDARHLAWGYVQYPPMTAFFAWVALKLFGTSLVGFRFFAALVQAVALVLTGLMARELGGGRFAQITAALAGVPFCLGGGALMQYISFDYVCWVFVAWAVVRLVTSGDARWWLAVGAGIGLGMLAKYTMGLLVAGVVVGVLLTGARRYLKSGWLWGGVVAAVLIFLPNFLWQWKHHFVSVEFLRFVHQRDVQTGVTDGFFVGQLELMILAVPLALAGLWFYFVDDVGQKSNHARGLPVAQTLLSVHPHPLRMLGWMYVVPLILLVVMSGRDYYLAPAYPMLYAAGAVWMERKIQQREVVRRAIWAALALDIAVAAAVALPIAPVNSMWWRTVAKRDIVFPEEIGWQEFTESVARVWQGLPPEEQRRAQILAGNYGEVGALNLYGPALGLPRSISGVNSSWERGYGSPPPQTVIVVGYPREFLQQHFASCEVRARVWNRYGVANEETIEDPDIYVCTGLRSGWPEFWAAARKFA